MSFFVYVTIVDVRFVISFRKVLDLKLFFNLCHVVEKLANYAALKSHHL